MSSCGPAQVGAAFSHINRFEYVLHSNSFHARFGRADVFNEVIYRPISEESNRWPKYATYVDGSWAITRTASKQVQRT